MDAFVPPWLQFGPQVQAENMRTGIEAAERNADRSENRQESARDSMIKMNEMAMAQRQQQEQMKQQQTQFQTKTALDTASLAIDKQEKDRQFALQQATQAQELALKKQQLDLQTQAAAQAFQWRKKYQQLTTPNQPTSADVAGADITGAPAPAAGGNLSPAEAFAQLGPPPDESMAGYGASLRAMTPMKAPLPPQLITDPSSGQQAWQYGNRLVPVKPPTDTSGKEDLETKKMKATFIQNYLSKAATNPDEIGKSVKDITKDAMDAWDAAMGEKEEGDDGTKTDATAPADSGDQQFKIIKVTNPNE